MSICAVCGRPCEDIEHHWFEGLGYASWYPGYRPVREWRYTAPLYHHPETHAPYCSPACASEALRDH